MLIEPLLPSAAARGSHRVSIGDVVVGGDAVPVIAGPCAVERRYLEHASAAAHAGASVLRGCVLKPRTSPDSFQGLGVAGLPLLDAARRETGLPMLAEPLQVEDVALLRDHVDVLMIGARSMHNTPLLRAAGASGLPVVLKRGMSATCDEWLQASRYVIAEGTDQVILCERGIRTFETATRNTLDISSIAVLRERTDLPIAVDPSHAAGRAAWVPSLALAAVAAGADALLIEAHPDPERSICDAAQAITPEVLAGIVQATAALAALVRPSRLDTIDTCRAAIDAIDDAVLDLLDRRASIVDIVQQRKTRAAQPRRDRKRERAMVDRLEQRAQRIDRHGVQALVHTMVEICLDAALSDAALPESDRSRMLA